MRNDILRKKEQILQWVAEGKTKAFMSKELHCKPETLNGYMKKMGIDYAGRPGIHDQNYDTRYKTAEEYINSGSMVKSHILKNKLIRDGIKKKECELCGVSNWRGVELPLELHHKDGNHYNNNLDNLAILCPNCHSIQDGNNGRTVKSKEEVQALRNEARKTDACTICGKIITKGSIYCQDCYHIQSRIVDRPDREKLKKLIRSISFLQIGKMYKVSDNTIRKWCDTYGLPRKSSDIKSYSDEEWDKI